MTVPKCDINVGDTVEVVAANFSRSDRLFVGPIDGVRGECTKVWWNGKKWNVQITRESRSGKETIQICAELVKKV